jgi:hypothetical protein
VGQGEDGAGLGEAVPGVDLDAQFGRLQRQPLREPRPADDHLPAAQVQPAHRRGGDNHLENGGDAVAEGDLLGQEQPHQHLRLIPARVDLLDAEEGGHVGDAPGVDVEHRREGHVDVVLAHAAEVPEGRHRQADRESMEDQLPLGEIDALRQAGRAGGVGHRRQRVLVQVGQFVQRDGGREQLLVLGVRFDVRLLLPVGDQNGLADGGDARTDALHQRVEVLVEDEDLVLGVGHSVGDVLGGQAGVDGVEDRADAGDGEVHLQVAVAVPLNDAHPGSRLHPQGLERAGEPEHPSVHGGVGVADQVAVDDFLVGGPGDAVVEDVLQEQLEVVCGHGRPPF